MRKIRITESDITRVVSNVLKEKFSKQSMKDAVKAGRGLDDNVGIDAREGYIESALADKEPVGRLSKEILNALFDANVRFGVPLNQQIIYCRDRSAIVIDPLDFDSGYRDKIQGRQANYYSDRGFGEYADKWSADDRNNAIRHGARRSMRRHQRGVRKARGQKPTGGDN